MIRRCVYLSPDGLDPKVQHFRERYDPLGSLIEPHVTLVFPFSCDITDEALVAHVADSVASDVTFKARLASRVSKDGDFIYFPIAQGAELIRSMHDRLYTGLLKPQLLAIPYVPHITIARAGGDKAEESLRAAAELKVHPEFSIGRLKIERVLSDGRGEVIDQIVLKAGI